MNEMLEINLKFLLAQSSTPTCFNGSIISKTRDVKHVARKTTNLQITETKYNVLVR